MPLDVSQCPKGYRVICMNTHILNTISSALGPTTFVTVLNGILGGPILPVFLAALGLMSLPVLLSQADARDFGLFKDGKEDPFWPGNEMTKMNVLAINDGTVVKTFNQIRNNDTHIRNTLNAGGNDIVIDHGSFYSYYAHLSYDSIKVKKGDKVKKGQPIARAASTGNSTAQHLHFETVYLNNPGMFGIVKPLTDYEPYKSTPIPWKEMLTIEELAELFQKYYNKPATLDTSGVIDSLAFIGDKK